MLFYLFWNITTGSASKSERSTVFPLIRTSLCFLTISHPMCEKKNPLLALCGSASVSVNLWCTLWSLVHSWMSFCRAVVCIIISRILKGNLASYVLWAQSLWAPAVMPIAANVA